MFFLQEKSKNRRLIILLFLSSSLFRQIVGDLVLMSRRGHKKPLHAPFWIWFPRLAKKLRRSLNPRCLENRSRLRSLIRPQLGNPLLIISHWFLKNFTDPLIWMCVQPTQTISLIELQITQPNPPELLKCCLSEREVINERFFLLSNR